MREGPDPFGVRDTIETAAGKATIYRLGKLEEKSYEGISLLPYSIRILLESLLRHEIMRQTFIRKKESGLELPQDPAYQRWTEEGGAPVEEPEVLGAEEEKTVSSEKAFRVTHVVVVDEDINIFDPNDVEFAIATRVKGDMDILIIPNVRGSSLDPRGAPDGTTTKVGIDATKVLVEKENFERAVIPE